MALKIDDITQFTGSEYGVYKFQAKAVDNTGVYADSELSNTVTYNIPLLKLSLSDKIVTITGFIDGVTGVQVYLDNTLVATLSRTTEESLTYTISDDVNPRELHKIYAVAIGDRIKENYSDAIAYGVGPIFADNDWKTINDVSLQIAQLNLTGDALYEKILQDYGWQVGDTKAITLTNGDTYNLQIWDFNDKVDKNGNKIGISFGCVELFRDTEKMNSTRTNVGGFGASQMARTTLPSIFELLPQELKDVVKETKITYHSGSDDPTTELSGNYKMYLASEYEIFGTTNYALQEGMFLKYWQLHNNNNDRRKEILGSIGAYRWWLRSASRDSRYYFALVFVFGGSADFWADSSYGVCFCLSI